MSADLTTWYLGLELSSPLVVGASPLTARADDLPALEQAGAAAVVLPSLFEEQIEHEEWETHQLQQFGAESYPEALSYFVEVENEIVGAESYLRNLSASKESVSIPVIASFNGTSKGGWVRYAQRLQDAGADALELNIYLVVTDPMTTGEQVEQRYLDLVAAVREAVSIPLCVKLSPYFSSMPNMARRLAEAGVDGLVLFNRFLQPDIDLESLEVTPNLVLSTSDELRLPLRWTAILRPLVTCSIAASTGVHSWEDVVKLLLAGADATQVVSSILKHGPRHLRALRDGLIAWMIERQYHSIDQLKGSMSQANCPDPEGFERANYMKMLQSYSS